MNRIIFALLISLITAFSYGQRNFKIHNLYNKEEVDSLNSHILQLTRQLTIITETRQDYLTWIDSIKNEEIKRFEQDSIIISAIINSNSILDLRKNLGYKYKFTKGIDTFYTNTEEINQSKNELRIYGDYCAIMTMMSHRSSLNEISKILEEYNIKIKYELNGYKVTKTIKNGDTYITSDDYDFYRTYYFETDFLKIVLRHNGYRITKKEELVITIEE